MKEIYTYVGPTLIAMNPYQRIQDLYSIERMQDYYKQIIEAEVANYKKL